VLQIRRHMNPSSRLSLDNLLAESQRRLTL
jgi:hypothetical protein